MINKKSYPQSSTGDLTGYPQDIHKQELKQNALFQKDKLSLKNSESKVIHRYSNSNKSNLYNIIREKKFSKISTISTSYPQSYPQGIKESEHKKFISFFFDAAQKVRKVKIIITGKDCKNLKRVLDLKIISEQELEQMAIYFLADWRFKKFAPSISTFLSAGIINGLIDNLSNRKEFWQELDGYLSLYNFRKQVENNDDLIKRINISKSLLLKKLGSFSGKTLDKK